MLRSTRVYAAQCPKQFKNRLKAFFLYLLTLVTFLAIPSFATAAVRLSGLGCSGGTMSGARTDACTVKLTGAASTGGVIVRLSSSAGAVVVPSIVTEGAGAIP